MSTVYRIVDCEIDERWTTGQLRTVAREKGFAFYKAADGGWIAAQKTEAGDTIHHVHLYFELEDKLYEFERFGGNSPDWFIEMLESYHYTIISEYDDEYQEEE